MKPLLGSTLAALFAAALLAHGAGAEPDVVTYTTDGATITHDCAGHPRVKIKARGGRYTFRGACDGIGVEGDRVALTISSVAALAIDGDGNRAVADQLGSVAIQGNGNKITYRRSRGGAPPVAGAGDDNTVIRTK